MKKSRNAILLRMPKRRGAPAFAVESRIMFLRNRRVILDSDLAELYGVPAKRLNQQVARNRERFPTDFMFHLNSKEHQSLRLQFATSKSRRGGRRYPPYAFTEHGAIMAATVLNSKRAVTTSVYVVRAFVRLRQQLSTDRRLAAKLYELENQLGTHDSAIRQLISAVNDLIQPKKRGKVRIGFQLPAAHATA